MSQPYVGEIRLFAGNFAPNGWMFCNGQLLAISEYDVIFDLIGTTYGGDGQTTFALPNLQSRVPVHVGSGFVIGQMSGTETVTLTVNQIPAHTHPAQAASGGGTSNNPAGNVWANWPGSQFSDQGITAAMNAAAVGFAGGSQSHDNRMPFLTLNFIISLFGIFPTQN
jgi:microcystin-dependent protein